MSELQIEEGKWYRRRDGAVVGPAWHRGEPSLYPWCLGKHEMEDTIYADDGRFALDGRCAKLDLVEEVPAPLPQHPVDVAIASELDIETVASTFGPLEQYATAPAAKIDPDGAFERAYAEAAGVAVDTLPSRADDVDGVWNAKLSIRKDPCATASAGYPDDNPKTIVGRAKPALRAIPPIAILHLGGAMGDGESKYGRFNWRDKTVTSSVYYDAIQRHLLAWWDGENNASDSGRHHLAHVMACCAILLDAEAASKLNDDRRKESLASAYVAGEVAQINIS